jgi:hypothetical protein
VVNFIRPLGFSLGLAVAVVFGLSVSAQAPRPDAGGEAAFLAENEATMNRMMADMNIKPTDDVDRDFVAMMVPHHQGAIDMAKILLRYGHNEQLRRLAQEIIVTQQQEIVAMHLAVGAPLPAPTQPQGGLESRRDVLPDHSSMHMK